MKQLLLYEKEGMNQFSLTIQQQENTIKELRENMNLAGLTEPELAEYFHVSVEKITRILNLEQQVLEDTWIIRNYLLETIKINGGTAVPFTALQGDSSDYWFLNNRKIEQQKLSKGEY